MFLEITPEERLIRKLQAVCYFLDTQIGGFQHYFYLQNDVHVDDVFGVFACHLLYDSGKVAGRDKQFVCIKANLALGGAMFVDQCDETFEKLVFAVGTFNLFSGEPPVRLFIYTQKKTLEMIPDNDIAEAVFAVQIDRLGGNHQAVNGLDAVIRKRKGGILFQEMEEGRFQMDGNLS